MNDRDSLPTFRELTRDVHVTVPDSRGQFVRINDPERAAEAHKLVWGFIQKAHWEIFEGPNALPSPDQFIDVKKVVEFKRNNGMNSEPLVVVSHTERERLQNIFREYDATYLNDIHGMHSTKLRLSVAEYSPAYSLVYGDDFTERVSIHEGGHAACEDDHVEVIDYEDDDDLIKSAMMYTTGFRQVHREYDEETDTIEHFILGDFFEEAYAEEKSAQYAEWIRDGRRLTEDGGKVVEVAGARMWIPERFLYMRHKPLSNGNHPSVVTAPTYAAVAMHNLGLINSAIPPLMEASRTDRDAIEELYNEVDAIDRWSGDGDRLSDRLRLVRYNEKQFAGVVLASYVLAERHRVDVIPKQISLPA